MDTFKTKYDRRVKATGREDFYRFTAEKLTVPEDVKKRYKSSGAALFAAIEFAKKEKDARFLWVLEKNADAIRFYEAHGFHLTGKRMPEEGTPEYKVLMER